MNIGLVLAGGMGKGAYEIGALKAVSEFFPLNEIKYISAASIGALNAYAYASGNLDYACKQWGNISKRYEKKFIKRVLDCGCINEVICKLISCELNCEKLYIPLLRWNDKVLEYIDIADIEKEIRKDYLEAAIAVFPICNPIEIKGTIFYDGACVDNIPIIPLENHFVDVIICIYFDQNNYIFESEEYDKKIIKITFIDDSSCLSESIWVTSGSTERMMELGYKKTKEIMGLVFSEDIDNINEIYSKIELLNSLQTFDKEKRLTGDIIINRMNKLAKKIIKQDVKRKE